MSTRARIALVAALSLPGCARSTATLGPGGDGWWTAGAGDPAAVTATEAAEARREGREDARGVAARRADVVRTAREFMGRPYKLGGTGVMGGGFDCSGLIQYAYLAHGLQLPRRSVEQARAGRPVGKDPGRLEPGDILTFANHGRGVTHVGMYVGEGRFIHSSSKGVRESVLSVDDPDGRWWLRRWVGVRRVLD